MILHGLVFRKNDVQNARSNTNLDYYDDNSMIEMIRMMIIMAMIIMTILLITIT
jgi:hypothetical protein